ncbi:MAG: FAD-dependent oxidoreductase [Flavobacteriaceae bacterium]|nr:MAG: FAD-dependent oxidoreductase [Flavobacteriaceae bacterium]
MSREKQLKKLKEVTEWDIIVIGGGASGLGIALDAVTRGFSTVLFEHVDFGKGTSGRSTKLVHGGVRYLAQGNISLVKEALKERGILSKNAKHLFKNQTFIIPCYQWWENFYYTIGLKIYDFLAKKLSLGKSTWIRKKEMTKRFSTLKRSKLSGGVVYHDGLFDDARLAVNLAQTSVQHGATVLNYTKVINLIKNHTGTIQGVLVEDKETCEVYTVKGKVVVNATGVFANKIFKLNGRKKRELKVVPSQGIHLVLDTSFLNSKHALMIPKTSDGRVLFIVPWHGKLIVGTTDTPITKPSYEPKAFDEEIDFILQTAAAYLVKVPGRKDVLSVFAGLRPLVAPEGDKKNTKEISRGHKIIVSETGLISILGGKWTTYRKMAEEVMDKAIEVHGLLNKFSVTETFSIHGSIDNQLRPEDSHWDVYGSDAENLQRFIQTKEVYAQKIHPQYDYTVGEIVWFIQNEMARTVEDILARRIRLLFLDAKAAVESAPKISEILAKELDKDTHWANTQTEEFIALAKNYLLN